MRQLVRGLASGLAMFVVVAPAEAATVSVSGTTVTYQAAPGEVNKPLVDTNATSVVFGDSVALTPGAGCEMFGETAVSCSGANVRAVTVRLGDRNDTMARNVLEGEVPAGAKLAVQGETGNDFIIGTTGGDTLNGGPGNDTVYGSGGKDTLKGGSGKDRITGYGTLDGGGGNDYLETFYGFGQYKPLHTIVFGRAGNDRVLAGNKAPDTVNCGSGKKDSGSTTDKRGSDTFKANCEVRPR